MFACGYKDRFFITANSLSFVSSQHMALFAVTLWIVSSISLKCVWITVSSGLPKEWSRGKLLLRSKSYQVSQKQVFFLCLFASQFAVVSVA